MGKKSPAPAWRTAAGASAALRAAHPHLRVDLARDADVTAAGPLCTELLRLGRRYPGVMECLTAVESPERPADGRTWGRRVMVSFPDGRIQVCPTYLRDGEAWRQRAEAQERAGRVPPGCGTIEAYVCHEFGHHVLRALGPEGERWARETPGREDVSRYARQSSEEGFAEAFASLEHGTARTPYVEELERFLSRWLAGKTE